MSFASDLKDFQLKFHAASDEVVAGVEISLYSAVILDSPVDTGRFRGNWSVSLNIPETAQNLLTTDPSGQATISNVTSFVSSLSGGRITYLTNNLPYAQRLEYGYSNQAQQGMVRKNVTRFQALVDQEAAKHKL